MAVVNLVINHSLNKPTEETFLRVSSHGCTTGAVRGGVCIRHGATVQICKHEGCKNGSVKGMGFVSWSRGSAVQMYYNLGAMDFVEVTGARSLDV
eukprot:scaffold3337_cov204-Alexandrium_tamarense.AAC.1